MTPAPELPPLLLRLLNDLGDFRAGGRSEGVFEWQWTGPGSVPELHGLEGPELGLDLMPFPPTPQQRAVLEASGYREQPTEGAGLLTFVHSELPRVVLLDHDAGQSIQQRLIREHLGLNAAARQRYREVFGQAGRAAADAALLPEAEAAHVVRTGSVPLERVAALLAPLELPWMFAAGWALDLYLQGQAAPSARAHEDTDIIVPYDAQLAVRDVLRAAGYSVHAVEDGMYVSWDVPLSPPHHQAHAFATGETGDMLDFMLSDLTDGQWHYRRDPSITLPLEQARRISGSGLPYLAPEAALLFKSATRGGYPRPKDQRDFERTHPYLDGAARAWLAQHLSAGHPWAAAL
ncbi:hypothetical protein MF271_15985 [Deinococcus sp. KNUC1210]|uniref:nucleotidyltransferase domain-containing protein n=1 Tax=Deinococcus sp. KNUC1210 TaxID=2917691 RepID=UPI001EF1334E|nr:hypothetical protein [Deinococcus sp. KNUC1210]ULH15402.1 hypothetical protein MF271_15985 [Deinococcus sp. KNUC1210]